MGLTLVVELLGQLVHELLQLPQLQGKQFLVVASQLQSDLRLRHLNASLLQGARSCIHDPLRY